MPVTLRDIAERIGVSPSVVSTVLSGRENGTFVSKDTRRRVLEVAQQLNYVPVRSGRPRGSKRLRRLHTEQFMGVWCPSTDRGSLGTIAAVQQALTDYIASDTTVEEGDTLGLRLISDSELPRLDSLGLMGLIVVGDVALPRSAAAANIPCVQIGEPDHVTRDVMSIHLDSFGAGQALGEYLWQLGHRTLAFVAPASKPRVTRHRWQGMQSVWVENGAPHTSCVPAPYDTDKSSSLREQVEAAVRKLYVSAVQRQAPSPTSLVSFDETVASYVLQSLHKIGRRVPEDVSVSTFGDTEGGAEAMAPPVTSIRLPLEALSLAAIQELYSHGDTTIPETDPRRDVKYAGQLVIRDSCAPPQ